MVEELVNPKYMTVGSYTLICIVNVIFYSLPSLILILLYPHLRSNFVNTFFLPTPSNISVIRSNRYLFLSSTGLYVDSLVLFFVFYPFLPQNILVTFGMT